MTVESNNRPIGLSQSGRFEHIDALRAFAVMLVVVAHAGLDHIVPGGSGVTIFFAISGFVITYHLLLERTRKQGEGKKYSIREFYIRRLFKLAPPFLVVVVIPTIALSSFFEIRWTDFLAQIFFCFNWLYIMGGDTKVLPGSGVTWSLSIEEQFYIVFSLIWLGIAKSRNCLAFLFYISGAVVLTPLALRIVLIHEGASHNRVYYGTDTRIDGIAWGVLAAAICFAMANSTNGKLVGVRRVLSSDWIIPTAVFAYLLSLLIRNDFFRETFRYSIQALAAALIILYGILKQDGELRRLFGAVSKMRFVQLVGLASYSIYLVHFQIDQLLKPFLMWAPEFIRIPIMIIAGVSVGILVWVTVEKPSERLKKKLLNSRARVTA